MAAITAPQPKLVCHQDFGIFAEETLHAIENVLSDPLHSSERTLLRDCKVLGDCEVLDRPGDPVFPNLGAFKRINFCVVRDLTHGEFTVYLALSSPVGCPQFAKEKRVFELLSDVPEVAKPLLIQTKGDREYMVSELYNQGDLLSLIDNKMKLRKFCVEEGKFKYIEIDKYFLDLAHYSLVSALNKCHERGIIHRDIKPDNILVRQLKNGELDFKLMDFGAAFFADEETKDEACQAYGTHQYFAASQLNAVKKTGKLLPANYSRDVFALGITLFAMQTGVLPGRHILDKSGQYKFEWFPRKHLDLGIFAKEIDEMVFTADSEQLPMVNTIQERMAAILSRTYPSLQRLNAFQSKPLLPLKPAYVCEEEFVRATTRQRQGYIQGENFASRNKEVVAYVQTPDCVSAEDFFSLKPRKRKFEGKSFANRIEKYTANLQAPDLN